MRFRATAVLAALLVLFLTPKSASAGFERDDWFLPQRIDDRNTRIRFEVDSTWHLVTGSTAEISGTAELERVGDPASVRVSLSIPVASFDTENARRDRRMREVMQADIHPAVTFTGRGLRRGCTPARVAAEGVCADLLSGELEIRGTRREVEVPIEISGETDGFAVRGRLPIAWADHGVEDPSILVAKLDSTVVVTFLVRLSPTEEV